MGKKSDEKTSRKETSLEILMPLDDVFPYNIMFQKIQFR